MFRLITSAFACGRTRVVTYRLRRLRPEEFGESRGKNIHQDFAHRENRNPNSNGSRRMTRMYTIAGRFRELVELLAATPEPSRPGESLLDHTVVLWLTEQEDGEHNYDKVPFVVAGRCGGAIRAGRHSPQPSRLRRQ